VTVGKAAFRAFECISVPGRSRHFISGSELYRWIEGEVVRSDFFIVKQQHDPTPPRGTFHRLDWSPFAIMGNTMPPRDPDEEDGGEEDEEGKNADEPPVVREPDED
jgi:hypothetical protein